MPRKRKPSTVRKDQLVDSVESTNQTDRIESMVDKRVIAIQGSLSRWVILLVIASLLSFIPGFFTQNLFSSPKRDGGKPSDVISRISSRIYLPEDEVPTVALVSDKSKLKQPFFARAENGDQVLIYTHLKKAVLYRPSIDKIIEYGPINMRGTTDGTTVRNPSPTSTPSLIPTSKVLTVAIYNGSGASGLAAQTEKQLKGAFPQLSVVKKENASSNGYKKTIVIDISGENERIVNQIAENFKGVVGDLPEGEKKPSADILIIVSE